MESNNEMTYTQAVTELEQLVQKMQDPQCSIDNLTAYTKRSKELLDICRKKLTEADEQLKQLKYNLDNSFIIILFCCYACFLKCLKNKKLYVALEWFIVKN